MVRLDKVQIISVALDLLDEVGMEALTTRKLAQKLGIEQPSLYWHVKNKRVLLDALAEEILVRHHTHSLPLENESWQEFLKNNALSFYNALLQYRDGAKIHLDTRPTVDQYSISEAQLKFMCDQGFSLKEALCILSTTGNFILGSALEAQSHETDKNERSEGVVEEEAKQLIPPLLQEAIELLNNDCYIQLLEEGLEAIIMGFEKKLVAKT